VLFRSILQKGKAQLIWGTKRRQFNIDHVVEICESGLAYDGALLIGGLTSVLDLVEYDESNDLVGRLQLFQKRLKYGLPTNSTIALYELGFSDRVIAMDLALSLGLTAEQKKDVVKALKRNKSQVLAVMDKYPSYFLDRANELL